MPNSQLHIRIHCGLTGLLELEAQWQILADQHAFHFVHLPVWHKAQLQAEKLRGSVFFAALTCSQTGSLQGVIPLHIIPHNQSKFRFPILQLFYDNEMGVSDALLAPGTLIDPIELIATLKKSLPFFLFIRWQNLPSNTRLLTALGKTSDFRHTHSSKFLDLSQGIGVFWQKRSKKFRKGLEKKYNKLAKLGVLSVENNNEHLALKNAYQTFLQLEDSGWKGERGTSIIKQPNKLAYYNTLQQDLMQSNQFRIHILYLDNTPIAAQLGVEISSQLYLLKIAYSEEHHQFSPGYLLLYSLLQQDPPPPWKKISFVTGVTWMDRWHPECQPIGLDYADNGSWYSRVFEWGLKTVIRLRQISKNRR